ncbi:acyltransferase family protein [Roseateles sp. GG27B]
MDATNPIPAFVATVLALATTWLLQRRYGAPNTQARFVAIDGLRGYLAFFVFLHHSCIWYFYLHSGQWTLPPSVLYTQFGQAGVAAFFMITAFLFSSKLLDSRRQELSWLRLYISRLLRLLPLYLFAMLLLTVLVAVLSAGELRVPLRDLLSQGAHWLLFTFVRAPDINGVPQTALLIAGVVWSLPFEWMFYFSLPLLALMLGMRVPLPALLLSIGALGWAVLAWQQPLIRLLPFGSGIVAALLVRWPRFCILSRSPAAGLLCLVCLLLIGSRYTDMRQTEPLLVLSLAFALIAGGNTLFGLLACGVSRLLGEMAYSLYLLHGLLLFTTMRFALGLDFARTLSPLPIGL